VRRWDWGKKRASHLAEEVDRRRHLLLHDLLLLLLLRDRAEALPGERAAEEVHEDVAEGLEVVAARLLDAEVVVDGRVARRAREVLVLALHDVHVSLRVALALREAEVDDVDDVRAAAEPHEEVIGLDVAVDEGLGVDVLDAEERLVRDREHRLEREAAPAAVEEVLEGEAEEVHDEDVLAALREGLDALPADVGDADGALEDLLELRLLDELRVLRLRRLELHRNLLARHHIRAEVDV
jgi:hypothetical protein